MDVIKSIAMLQKAKLELDVAIDALSNGDSRSCADACDRVVVTVTRIAQEQDNLRKGQALA